MLFGKCGLKRWFAHWPQEGFSAPAMLKKFFLATIISHGLTFCSSCGSFTRILFFFPTGSTSVCYKPTSPVQVLEDTGFLYQDHQLFAGRHEASPLTAEVIGAKEKAGKYMATLLYEPTAYTSRFFPKYKSSSLNHLQVIFREMKASFSFFVESKLTLICVLSPTCTCGECIISTCPLGHGCF